MADLSELGVWDAFESTFLVCRSLLRVARSSASTKSRKTTELAIAVWEDDFLDILDLAIIVVASSG